ncbi:tryptophan 2,3-dioxygenase family protein [Vampirovibrio sp.]|uniref:tryptophan 2,3-dioxygenase family protein n=1 Tax=Vampirovibrio sp. TaxID=2717857 RepID=UPI003593184D
MSESSNHGFQAGSTGSDEGKPHPDVTGRYYIPGFPIGEGKTDYEKYLRTVELLSLQKSAAESVSPEELLFQVTHQASELWMKLMLRELNEAIAFMAADNLWMALRSLRLVHDCQRVLVMQVDLIGSHISIVEYGKIRTALGQGSGMESPGFNWLLEMAPKLGEALDQLLIRRQITIREIYTQYQQHMELHTLCEALMDYDDLFHKWRAHHMALVARTIGTDSNSLKGLATQVLQKGVKIRFFPELLEIRSILTNESGVAYGGQPLGSEGTP